MHKHGLRRHAVSVCLSVRVFVTFVDSVKTNKHIFKKISPSSSHAILVFPHQTSWQYSDENPSTGASNAGGIGRNRDSEPISGSTALWSLRQPCVCYQHGSAGPWQVVTLTASSKRRRLLMAGDDDEIFMTRSLDVTPKTTEQHLSVRSDKSVACITNNKSLCSAFCTIEANYWQTRSIARPLCDSKLLVCFTVLLLLFLSMPVQIIVDSGLWFYIYLHTWRWRRSKNWDRFSDWFVWFLGHFWNVLFRTHLSTLLSQIPKNKVTPLKTKHSNAPMIDYFQNCSNNSTL